MRLPFVPLGLAAALFVLPREAAAQHENDPMLPPAGWRYAPDAPARLHNGGKFTPTDSTFEFVHMAPGWHITMGPGAALYDPRERASGRFWVTGELIAFPNASNEEYGVFIGGQSLDDDARKQWFAFVVRVDGSAAVMHRAGAETHLIVPWAKHDAVKPRPDGQTVTNVVQVRAEPDSVRFFVNGQRITALPRANLPLDGPFGFRIGKGVNLHATNLDVTRRLAPHPAQR